VTETPKERVKVFDFGIARVEWEEMRITNIGAPLGTPGYMSPEQESGEEVDARSDIFAAGAVIYECFCGQPPAASPADMWKPAMRSRLVPSLRGSEPEYPADSGVHEASRPAPPAPEPSPVDVPAEWRALVERALARRAADRFQDARSLLGAIRRLESASAGVSQPNTGSDKS
jgi:serine/threonine-protein kinase